MVFNQLLIELKHHFEVEVKEREFAIKISADNLFSTMSSLFNELSFQLLIDLFVIAKYHPAQNGNTDLMLLLEHKTYPIRLRVRIALGLQQPPLKSLSTLWHNAIFFEQEINNSIKNCFTVDKKSPFSIGHSFAAYNCWNIDRSFMHGDAKLFYKMSGDLISEVHMAVESTLLRREQELVNSQLEHYPLLFSRLFPDSAQALTSLFYKSLEELTGTDITSRQQAFRMIVLELERIGNVCSLLKNVFINSENNVLLKIIDSLIVELSAVLRERVKKHFGMRYPRLVANRINSDWMVEVRKYLSRVNIAMDKIGRTLYRNDFFFAAQNIVLDNISYSSQLDGFLLKATGRSRDRRLFSPYYLYDQLNFSPTLGQQRVQDIFLVWLAEVEGATKNIEQLIAGMPRAEEPLKKGNIELIDNFLQLDTSNLTADNLLPYFSIDTLRGELGIWWDLAAPTPRLRIRFPSSAVLPYFVELCKGAYTEDIFWLLPFWGINLREFR